MEALVHQRALGSCRALPLFAVALLLITSCDLTNPFLPRSALQGDPAAKIRYPDSTELAKVGYERQVTLEGPAPAVDGFIFGADTSRDEVFYYYDRELRRLGWQQDTYSIYRSTVELVAWGWCKPRMTFRLGVKDASRAFQADLYQGRTYQIVFEANLQGREADVPCPKR